MKVYRKVKTSERLPTDNGWYDTDMGNLKLTMDIKLWQDVERDNYFPFWWLEPIELPNDEALSFGNKGSTGSNIWWFDKGFTEGANYILNKLNNNNESKTTKKDT